MLVALTEPVEVHVTGGSSALPGQILIAVLAMLAAVLTVWTTNRRQREQLAHDRELRRREHVRDALDAVLELVGEIRSAFGPFVAEVEFVEADRERLLLELQDPEADAQDKQVTAQAIMDITAEHRRNFDTAFGKLEEIRGAVTRLMLRLGIDHYIPNQAQALVDSWGELKRSFRPLTNNRTDEQKGRTEKAQEESAEAYASFMTDCSRWLREEID